MRAQESTVASGFFLIDLLSQREKRILRENDSFFYNSIITLTAPLKCLMDCASFILICYSFHKSKPFYISFLNFLTTIYLVLASIALFLIRLIAWAFSMALLYLSHLLKLCCLCFYTNLWISLDRAYCWCALSIIVYFSWENAYCFLCLRFSSRKQMKLVRDYLKYWMLGFFLLLKLSDLLDYVFTRA
jgi:hypothetical protein